LKKGKREKDEVSRTGLLGISSFHKSEFRIQKQVVAAPVFGGVVGVALKSVKKPARKGVTSWTGILQGGGELGRELDKDK